MYNNYDLIKVIQPLPTIGESVVQATCLTLKSTYAAASTKNTKPDCFFQLYSTPAWAGIAHHYNDVALELQAEGLAP